MPSWLTARNLILVWLASEVIALVAVVHAFGWLGAVLIGLATSSIGIWQFRRIGSVVSEGLRSSLRSGRMELVHSDVTLAGLGALLLVLPGFVSDLAGIALTAPGVRAWLRSSFETRSASSPDGVVDLDPADWRDQTFANQRRKIS